MTTQTHLIKLVIGPSSILRGIVVGASAVGCVSTYGVADDRGVVSDGEGCFSSLVASDGGVVTASVGGVVSAGGCFSRVAGGINHRNECKSLYMSYQQVSSESRRSYSFVSRCCPTSCCHNS